MTYDVVVVGGGIGGLTVAALLATRGLKVCLFERQSQFGGCVARVEFSNLQFDPGMGLYTGFGEGEVFEQLFNELKLAPPKTTPVESEYVVRLTGDVDVRLFRDKERFAAELGRAFSECESNAIEFYKRVEEISDLSLKQEEFGSKPRNLISNIFRRRPGKDAVTEQIYQYQVILASSLLNESSPRFKRFIDAQLRTFIQTDVEDCDLFSAAIALAHPRRQAYEIEGGPSSLTERLVEAIKAAGGSVRLNTSVLRVAWDSAGHAVGLDLLSGETVHATKAIVSNMTIWDTYGKLIGVNRIPAEIKSQLSKVNSAGVYLIYAALEGSVIPRLPSKNFLVTDDQSLDELTFAIGASTGTSHPVTIKMNCELEPWFAYQASEEDAEERDQEMLESLWERLHRTLPELGSAIEVIETANPRTLYDQTRRKLGMAMGYQHSTETNRPSQNAFGIYMVGDTVSTLPTLDSIAESALTLANRITK